MIAIFESKLKILLIEKLLHETPARWERLDASQFAQEFQKPKVCWAIKFRH